MSLLRLSTIFAVLLALSAAFHGYFYARLVRATSLPPPWDRGASLALILLALAVPAAMLLQRRAAQPAVTPVLWVCFAWMGIAFLLFFLLVAGEFVRLGWDLWKAAAGSVSSSGTLLLSRWIAAVAIGGSLVLGAVGLVSASRPPRVKVVPIHLSGWPSSTDGYSIVQLSDLHVGPTLGRKFLSSVIRRTMELAPDLVVITGDLVDGTVPWVGPVLSGLRDLKAPDGVYFVTGNHEYYSGAESWIRFLPSLGLRVLSNERVTIRDAFDLAGIEDWSAGRFLPQRRPDLAAALSGRDTGRPVILLAHQPRAVGQAAALGVDLQLSGHTHGGQVFPFHALVRLAQPFLAGLHRVGRTQVYVSRGTGYWGPPLRLAAPAEITLLRISRE